MKATRAKYPSSGPFIPGENRVGRRMVFTSRHEDTWSAVTGASAWAHTHFSKHYNFHERVDTLVLTQSCLWEKFWLKSEKRLYLWLNQHESCCYCVMRIKIHVTRQQTVGSQYLYWWHLRVFRCANTSALLLKNFTWYGLCMFNLMQVFMVPRGWTWMISVLSCCFLTILWDWHLRLRDK